MLCSTVHFALGNRGFATQSLEKPSMPCRRCTRISISLTVSSRTTLPFSTHILEAFQVVACFTARFVFACTHRSWAIRPPPARQCSHIPNDRLQVVAVEHNRQSMSVDSASSSFHMPKFSHCELKSDHPPHSTSAQHLHSHSPSLSSPSSSLPPLASCRLPRPLHCYSPSPSPPTPPWPSTPYSPLAAPRPSSSTPPRHLHCSGVPIVRPHSLSATLPAKPDV